MVQLRARAALTARSTHFGFILGNVPGKAASMMLKAVFGGAEKWVVGARENSFWRALICTWVSIPITTCQPSTRSRDMQWWEEGRQQRPRESIIRVRFFGDVFDEYLVHSGINTVMVYR
jgi:hypothetical protein